MALNTATDTLVANAPKSSGGEMLGQSTSDPVGFHGATPIAKATVAALAGTLTGTIDGTIVDIAATAGSCAGGSTPTAAQVDTAIATAVASIVTGSNTQHKELQAVLNNVLVALQNKGLLG